MRLSLMLLLLAVTAHATERTILPTQEDAKAAAIAHARKIHANWTWAEPTGSMRPTIQDGWFIVRAKTPYASLRKDTIALYRAKWSDADSICHRLVLKDKGGWIASGDNNRYSESGYRVTEENYVSEVVAIYGWKTGR